MVYGLVIHKINAKGNASNSVNGFNLGKGKKKSKQIPTALYTQFFSSEGNDSKHDVRVGHLIDAINSEFRFRHISRTSRGFNITETLAGTPAVSTDNEYDNNQANDYVAPPGNSTPTSGSSSLSRVLSFRSPTPRRQMSGSDIDSFIGGAEEGVTRIPRGSLFERAKILVWRHVLGCGYTLVCEPHENLVMASTWISNFIAVLSKHFNNPRISQRTEIFTDSYEDILTIVNTFLPCGVLCMYNGSMVNQLHKSIVENTEML
eukprot:g7578.t1